MLTVGSLFSGIGGIDLGLERAGMTVQWHSEIDPFACRVLKKHWPDVPNIGDITKVEWENVPYVDVIAGGYPCQPFSLAGKRAGENDPRHLWPYFRTAISHLRPRYALLENVRGHLTLGGTAVIADLAAIGYDCEWRIISAASVGANHRRDRLIIVAYPYSKNESTSTLDEQRVVPYTNRGRLKVSQTGQQSGEQLPGGVSRHRQTTDVADTNLRQTGGGHRWNATNRSPVFGWENYCRGTQGYAGREWWQTEPSVGRLADGVPHRVDRLRGLGNAVVPQVAEIVGRLIMAHADA